MLDRRWIARVGALGMLVACVAPARADDYPNRPVTIVIPFTAGSITDTAARIVAERLEKALGQPFVIDNRPGAGGLLAARTVARATPDGYTLLITTNSTHSAAPGLFKNVPYDPINDFTPVARIGSFPSVMAISPSMPVTSMKEFVAYAKANPGKVSYAYGNSTGQITGEAMAKRLGLDMARVAYRSNPEALTALIGGQVSIMALDFSNALPQLATKSVRPLAVLTKARSATMPDVPTLDETIMPDYDLLAWAGVFGPAALPPEVTRKLSAALESSLNDPEVKARFGKFGIEIFYTGPAAFADYVKTELVKWTALIKEAGIQPE
jgi:tripartite-type tricarboxylate transporter receptor subunit TctC